MKIAIVHDFLFKLGGAERVVKELSELYPEAPIYTLLYDEKKCGEVFPRERVIPSSLQRYPLWLRRRPWYLLKKMPFAIEEFDFSQFDLVISSSGAFSHGAMTGPQTKHLCYCHSPMRYAWDYTHEYLKERNLLWWQEYLVRKMLFEIRQWDRVAADRPDQYLANSKHVRRRLKKYFQVDAPVLYPPVDVDRFTPSSLHEDYFLIISALTAFKKIELAISTFNKIGKKLLIVGDGVHRRSLEALAGPTVQLLGRKSDKEVKRLLERARALIFPHEEDFGIVPVEAMAAGKPVIAFGTGGVLETVIDPVTGVFFFQPTVDALEKAIARFFEQEKSFDPLAIRQRAEFFHPQFFRKRIQREVDRLMTE